jgi:hypothetical protein
MGLPSPVFVRTEADDDGATPVCDVGLRANPCNSLALRSYAIITKASQVARACARPRFDFTLGPQVACRTAAEALQRTIGRITRNSHNHCYPQNLEMASLRRFRGHRNDEWRLRRRGAVPPQVKQRRAQTVEKRGGAHGAATRRLDVQDFQHTVAGADEQPLAIGNDVARGNVLSGKDRGPVDLQRGGPGRGPGSRPRPHRSHVALQLYGGV